MSWCSWRWLNTKRIIWGGDFCFLKSYSLLSIQIFLILTLFAFWGLYAPGDGVTNCLGSLTFTWRLDATALPFPKILSVFFAKVNDRRTTFSCEAWCIVGVWCRGHWTWIWLIFQPKWECWGLWLIWFANICILWGSFDIFFVTNCIYFQTKWGEQLLPVLDHWTLPQWVPASDNE